MARAIGITNSDIRANVAYWFERELRQCPPVDLNLDALQEYADRIMPAGGRESRGYPTYEVNAQLAKKLGRELIELLSG